MKALITKTMLVVSTSLMLASGAALAGREDTIEANRDVLRQRIEQGRYNGQLTRREYRELNAEQAKIEADIARAKEDGRVSRREYQKIHDEQIAAYRHVKEDNTNSKVSFWRRWLFLTRD
jgi:predicted  nucleic acid-binding Zn ribbon protein